MKAVRMLLSFDGEHVHLISQQTVETVWQPSARATAGSAASPLPGSRCAVTAGFAHDVPFVGRRKVARRKRAAPGRGRQGFAGESGTLPT